MIERRHASDSCESRALYSEDERYRFELTRRWGSGPGVLFIMLNPSKATELANDPTVERCERRARGWGHGAFSVTNIFAFRATLPSDLKRAEEPVGAGNDVVIRRLAAEAGLVVCAWGHHGAHLGRGARVAGMLREQGVVLSHLGLTKGGHPRHPLYLGYARAPEVWQA